MRKFINKKVSLSGNSAHYSESKLEELSPIFKKLKSIELNADHTVCLYHYGYISKGVVYELKTLGRILTEPLILFGYNYTDDKPLVVVIHDEWLEFSDATLEVTSTREHLLKNLESKPFIKQKWNSHQSPLSHCNNGIPKIVNIVEPNCDFHLGEI